MVAEQGAATADMNRNVQAENQPAQPAANRSRSPPASPRGESGPGTPRGQRRRLGESGGSGDLSLRQVQNQVDSMSGQMSALANQMQAMMNLMS